MLYLIGTGLRSDDLSLRALESLKSCSKIFIDSYTSEFSSGSISDVEQSIGKKITPLERSSLESDYLVNLASKENIALLVIGDVFSATTHISLVLSCEEKKVKYEIIHSASIFPAVCETGLQIYSFGRLTSIPKFSDNFKPEDFYDVFSENFKRNLHTLFLLDLKVPVQEAVKILLEISNNRRDSLFTEKTQCIAVSKFSSDSQKIIFAPAEEIMRHDFPAPSCLIVPGKLHFIELDALKRFKTN